MLETDEYYKRMYERAHVPPPIPGGSRMPYLQRSADREFDLDEASYDGETDPRYARRRPPPPSDANYRRAKDAARAAAEQAADERIREHFESMNAGSGKRPPQPPSPDAAADDLYPPIPIPTGRNRDSGDSGSTHRHRRRPPPPPRDAYDYDSEYDAPPVRKRRPPPPRYESEYDYEDEYPPPPPRRGSRRYDPYAEAEEDGYGGSYDDEYDYDRPPQPQRRRPPPPPHRRPHRPPPPPESESWDEADQPSAGSGGGRRPLHPPPPSDATGYYPPPPPPLPPLRVLENVKRRDGGSGDAASAAAAAGGRIFRDPTDDLPPVPDPPKYVFLRSTLTDDVWLIVVWCGVVMCCVVWCRAAGPGAGGSGSGSGKPRTGLSGIDANELGDALRKQIEQTLTADIERVLKQHKIDPAAMGIDLPAASDDQTAKPKHP